LTSPVFAAPANSLLVALIAVDTNAPRVVNSVRTVASSVLNGSPLVWTRATGASQAGAGDSEIWWAFSPLAQPTVSVAAKITKAAPGSMTVMAFTGVANTLVGAAANGASGASGAPTVSLTTTRGFSVVVGVANTHGAAHAAALTPAAGQTIVHRFSGTPAANGDTFWVQRTTAAVATPSLVTIRTTYTPATMPDPWNMAAVEIRVP
jgi:hypothetical protein